MIITTSKLAYTIIFNLSENDMYVKNRESHDCDDHYSTVIQTSTNCITLKLKDDTLHSLKNLHFVRKRHIS